jgi:hypothetical protein
MTRMKPFLPLIAACAALAGPAAAQTAISPGYWEMTNQVVSPLPSKKTERRCIKPAEVEKFMQGPENHIYRCTYPTRQVGDGRIRMSGTCASKDRSFPATLEGQFTADTLRVDAHATVKLGGLNVAVHGRTIAKRLGDACPAEGAASTGR